MANEFEEEIEIPINMDQATINKYKNRKKDDILNSLFVAILDNRLKEDEVNRLQEQVSGLLKILEENKRNLQQAKEIVATVIRGW